MKVLLSFVFLFVFGLSVSAQSPTVADLFSEGAKHVNAGQFDAALTSYQAALSGAENKYADKNYRARLHYNIGVCYFHLDNFELAADHFKHAVLLKTDYSLAYYALGIARIQIQKSRAGTSQTQASLTK
ncbi:MAG TPA: tetratricopeptide repeat protein [Pyrinomonadaceae bacterium]|nr:tetratricopeptide repeat protein [Pyrinomonadaceae bacterium]